MPFFFAKHFNQFPSAATLVRTFGGRGRIGQSWPIDLITDFFGERGENPHPKI